MVFTHDKSGHEGAGGAAADPWDPTAAGGRSALTLSFDSAAATLESCGGKGINLVRLTRAGFRVPPGFVVAADAYRLFVAANDLTTRLGDLLAGVDAGDVAALEAASDRIRRAFADGAIPVEVAEAVRAAWEQTFEPGSALAVRSSATAEDLPDLSFAGQQDTFLNVVGLDAVLEAVVSCWSSLWTARAIGYRARNAIPHEGVALAAVVQLLVPAQASGVLFTANPLTGARTETVIDATWGLGEALVSGQVEPDHFVVDSETGRISRSVGAKAVVTTALPGGGVATSAREPDPELSLSDAEVRELVAL
ncbi:MAG TPA: PEP/pyruvate-binding domain-containing protein, partial [Arachnia sp.]|nr:PEP/pyruvate-binding domain-containing protein [Arachnia sp.]